MEMSEKELEAWKKHYFKKGVSAAFSDPVIKTFLDKAKELNISLTESTSPIAWSADHRAFRTALFDALKAINKNETTEMLDLRGLPTGSVNRRS